VAAHKNRGVQTVAEIVGVLLATYVTHGTLDADKSNAILMVTAISETGG